MAALKTKRMIQSFQVSGHGIFLLLLCTPLVFSDLDGLRSSCAIVKKEHSGTLTCQFSENIGQAKYNFVVHRYDLDVTDTSPEIVLDCHWPSKEKEKQPFCLLLDGYVFDGKVSDEAVIDIPLISGKHKGRYLCQILTRSTFKSDVCNYTGGSRLEDPTTMVNPHPPAYPTTMASTNASRLTTSPENKSTETTTGIYDGNLSRIIVISALTTIITIILAVLLLFAIYKCYKKRVRGEKARGKQEGTKKMVKDNADGGFKGSSTDSLLEKKTRCGLASY